MGATIRNLFVLLLLHSCLVVAAAPNRSNVLYVARNGNDANVGTLSNPLASLDRAVELIASQRANGNRAHFSVFVREGRYDMMHSLVLDGNDRDITIAAYRNEKVVLSGGKQLSPNAASRAAGCDFEKMLPKSSIDSIYFIDLKKENITSYGTLRNVGFARPNGPAWMELFINGKPGRLARWPNSGKVPIGKIIDEGSIPRNGDYSNRGAIFSYNDERPSRWASLSDVWISGYFRHGYAEDAIRIASIDTVLKQIKTDKPHRYGFGSGSPWNSWYAYNIPQEIDQDGEYYVDRHNGLLFFCSSHKLASLEVSILEDPIISLEGASDITIKGIHFTCTRGMGVYMERTNSCLISGCSFYNIGSMAVCIGKGVAPAEDDSKGDLGSPASRIVGNLQEYIYQNPAFNREGGSNNGIIGCHIYRTGAGGVHISGGDRQSLKPAGNFISGCSISDYNRIEKSYRAGVDISGVGNRISRCEIFDAPSMAIILHGNNHTIEYCDIHDVCLEVDDQGALYYGRDPSECGHNVRYCYFHHLGNEHRTTAVYHDDGACGMSVYGCVFLKAGTLPVLIGGGSYNSYHNNLFVDCPVAIHIDNRLENWSSGLLKKDGLFEQRLMAVRFNQPPYSTTYPWLLEYWKRNPAKPSNNMVHGNIFCSIGSNVHGDINSLDWANNVTIKGYPASWKSKMALRSFIPNEPSSLLPDGWKRIPTERIGIKKR